MHTQPQRPLAPAAPLTSACAESSDRLRILCADRNVEWQQHMAAFARTYGFEAIVVADLPSASALLRRHRFDVVIADVTPPDTQGLEFIRRMSTLNVGVIATSALKDDAECILALEAGADEYLAKPFSGRVLLAYLRALQRRVLRGGDARPASSAAFGNWIVDLERHTAQNGARDIRLTAGEAQLLTILLRHPRRVLTRLELLTMTEHDDGQVFDRTIDVMMSRLRSKFDGNHGQPSAFETVRGKGYRFTQAVTWHSGDQIVADLQTPMTGASHL